MQPTKAGLWTAGLGPACRRDAGGPDDSGWRSRGYLPHRDSPNLVQHVVFRLADSLPTGLQRQLGQAGSGDQVVAIDAALDRGHGRRELAIPTIAELVQTALLRFDADRYALIAWCVMPNHVHALLTVSPGYRLDRIVHSWKSYTAKAANLLLGRSGVFWAREYFDRFMRDADHLARTVAYIEGNPVMAGLCENVADRRFSSAWRGWGRRDAGGPGGPGDAWTTGLRPACRRDAGSPDIR
jgi:REP element-mobilizing transposase RayT